MKKFIVIILLLCSLFTLCSCSQREPSIEQLKKEAEEAREYANEMKEKERQLQTLVDGLRNP